MSIYEYSVPTPKGEDFPLSAFEGKVFLVVNTATGCGFTPQYKDLEEMYEKYHDRGFEILDIPCNQFAGQTPGTDDEIHEFCTLRSSRSLRRRSISPAVSSFLQSGVSVPLSRLSLSPISPRDRPSRSQSTSSTIYCV